MFLQNKQTVFTAATGKNTAFLSLKENTMIRFDKNFVVEAFKNEQRMLKNFIDLNVHSAKQMLHNIRERRHGANLLPLRRERFLVAV